ncbi:cytochrome-c oxidase, cbb3-type subunit III [Shimia sp.]|uniref:cytochrome-c oxidase, cbb3-type subunit III n=1 Tax=Shimia sp. TaxID=1954381 RepID=UPI00356570CA
MSTENKKKNAQGFETTGHSWDGIEEWNNPLPRWWVWVFYATIVWGIGYTIAYPAWPGIKGATAGMLGFSTRGEVAAEIDRFAVANAPNNAKLEATDLAGIKADAELSGYATSAGAAVFKTWCAQCHGSGAAGAVGYPNLLDNDWLWGGDIESIHATVSVGIRQQADADGDYLRQSEMTAFGEMLEAEEVDAVVNYVMSLSGDAQDASKVAAGAAVFEENCTSCHGEDGSGDRSQGAPNLTDAIWLYGGDYATVSETVNNGRKGAMPAWQDRLSEAQIRAVSVYVHQLGGGE